MNLERHSRCTHNPVGIHHIPSSSGTNIYTTCISEDISEVHGGRKHTCTCTGFMTKRNKHGGFAGVGHPDTYCRHIKGLVGADGMAAGCGWTTADPMHVAPTLPRVCPLCFSPTETYIVAPDVQTDEELADMKASLLALASRKRP